MASVKSMKSLRIQSLDGMRFVMCLGIAIYHFAPYFFHPGEIGYDHTRKFAYFTDIFFVISGFFLARSNENIPLGKDDVTRFFSLRLARIYPLHLACLAFYVAIAVIAALGGLSPDNPERYDLGQILPNMLLIHSWGVGDSFSFNFVSWSLSALWLMYLAYPLTALLARFSVGLLAALVATTLFAGEWLAADLCREPITQAQACHMGILRAIPSFLFGVLLAHIGIGWIGRRAVFAGLIVLTCTILAAPLLEGAARLVLVYGLLIFFLAADESGLRTPLAWRGLTKYARYSFGIFLIHPIVATILFSIVAARIPEDLLARTGPDWLLASGWLAAGLLATVAAAALSYSLLEKPAEKALAQRIARSDPKGSPWR